MKAAHRRGAHRTLARCPEKLNERAPAACRCPPPVDLKSCDFSSAQGPAPITERLQARACLPDARSARFRACGTRMRESKRGDCTDAHATSSACPEPTTHAHECACPRKGEHTQWNA
eukprot:3323859-Pleurochrysis_carterae.AAC.9